MKRINASLMTVAVVLALIAFIAPSSAYSISNGNVKCVSGETTWTFAVTCGPEGVDPHAISHFTVAWCSEIAVKEVWVGSEQLFRDGNPNSWDYGDFGEGIKGIKIDYPVEKGHTITVRIILDDCYGDPVNVAYVIKAGGLYPTGYVKGPLACNTIPEFSTIAIPIASILGLLFFFNRRKRRDVE